MQASDYDMIKSCTLTIFSSLVKMTEHFADLLLLETENGVVIKPTVSKGAQKQRRNGKDFQINSRPTKQIPKIVVATPLATAWSHR